MTKITAVKVTGTKFGPKGDAELKMFFALPEGVNADLRDLFACTYDDIYRKMWGNNVRIQVSGINQNKPIGELTYTPRFDANLEYAKFVSTEDMKAFIDAYLAEVERVYPVWAVFKMFKNSVKDKLDHLEGISYVSMNIYKDLKMLRMRASVYGKYLKDKDPAMYAMMGKHDKLHSTFGVDIEYPLKDIMNLTVERISADIEKEAVPEIQNYMYWKLATIMVEEKLGSKGLNYDHPSYSPGEPFLFKICKTYAMRDDPGNLVMEMKDNKTFYDYVNGLTDAHVEAFVSMFKIKEVEKEQSESEKAYKEEAREERKALKNKKEELVETWDSMKGEIVKMMASK